MSVFRRYFSSCLALAVFSCATVQAERFEFILHDFQIKKDLAAFRLNLDKEWKALFDGNGNYEEDRCSKLSQKIVDAFNAVTIKPPTVKIPSTDQDFSYIFDALNYKPLSKDDANHATNSNNFNHLLKIEHLDKVINLEDDQVDKTVLFQEIVTSICSYVTQEAIAARLDADKNAPISHLHIFIKLIIDTNEKTITLQTAPHAAQNGFVKTYSDDEVATWFDEEDTFEEPNEEEEYNNQQDSKVSPNRQYSRISNRRSSCGRFAKLATLSLIALSLGVLANSYIHGTLQDMVDTETLSAYAEELGVTGYVEQLTEFFGNLNITQ